MSHLIIEPRHVSESGHVTFLKDSPTQLSFSLPVTELLHVLFWVLLYSLPQYLIWGHGEMSVQLVQEPKSKCRMVPKTC